MDKENKIYKVNLIKSDELTITGKGESSLWEQSVVLNDFISPWDTVQPSEIKFRSLWDGKHLFFCFTVYDSKIHIDKKDDSVDSIGNSDRVELFFRRDESLNPYYCLEIDTKARVMDFIAYPDKNFDFDWNWPMDEIIVKSSKDEMSFTVEGAISMDSLRQFGLIKENKMEVGIFRAKYNSSDSLHFEPTWISWVHPNTEEPNFHIASSFGVFYLMS